MLGGVTGVGRGNPATGESGHNFGAMSAPPHINTQVTRETAVRVYTAQEHAAGHGWAASRDGYARLRIVRTRVEAQRCFGFQLSFLVPTERRFPPTLAPKSRIQVVKESHMRTALRSVAVITLTVVAGCVSGCAAPRLMAQPMFIGDYSTGDFSQWAMVQNRGYNGPGVGYVPTYSATVVTDPAKGKAARFELRSGDRPAPGFAGGERSEVGSTAAETGGPREDSLVSVFHHVRPKFSAQPRRSWLGSDQRLA